MSRLPHAATKPPIFANGTLPQTLTDGLREAGPESPNFLSLYCEKFGLTSDCFETVVFWKTLYPHAKLVGYVLCPLYREIFASDIDFIRRVGLVESIKEYNGMEARYRQSMVYFSSFRRGMRMRVSMRRLRDVAKKVLTEISSD